MSTPGSASSDDTFTRTEGAHPTRGAARDAVDAQRSRYGGIKWGAAFFGWLSANGLAVLLIALISAGGLAIGLTEGIDNADDAADQADTIGIAGGIVMLVVLFLAYLAGGYVAGRMARFDGARQGIAVWVIGLVVVLALAVAGLVFGSEYNVLRRLDLPRIPIDEGTATTGGIKWGAAFFGWLSANGLAVLLIALLSAGGVAIGLTENLDTVDAAAEQADTIGIAGGIALLVVLFLAYLAGGYVAGRMARFDGAKQGIAVWLWAILIAIILAVLGAVAGSQFNVLAQLNGFPRIPIGEGALTTGGIIALVIAVLVPLLAAVLGELATGAAA